MAMTSEPCTAGRRRPTRSERRPPYGATTALTPASPSRTIPVAVADAPSSRSTSSGTIRKIAVEHDGGAEDAGHGRRETARPE